jgi:hypothetical protein
VGKLSKRAQAIGLPRKRGDRDFRKQTPMTRRTLRLENLLMTFLGVLTSWP